MYLGIICANTPLFTCVGAFGLSVFSSLIVPMVILGAVTIGVKKVIEDDTE